MQVPRDIHNMALAHERILGWAKVVEGFDHRAAVAEFGPPPAHERHGLCTGHWRAPVQLVMLASRRLAYGPAGERPRSLLVDDVTAIAISGGAVLITSRNKDDVNLHPIVGFAGQLSELVAIANDALMGVFQSRGTLQSA